MLVVVGLFFPVVFPLLHFSSLNHAKYNSWDSIFLRSQCYLQKNQNKQNKKNLKRRLGLKEICVRGGPDSWSLPLTGTRIPTPALIGLLCGLEQASLPNSEPQFPHL